MPHVPCTDRSVAGSAKASKRPNPASCSAEPAPPHPRGRDRDRQATACPPRTAPCGGSGRRAKLLRSPSAVPRAGDGACTSPLAGHTDSFRSPAKAKPRLAGRRVRGPGRRRLHVPGAGPGPPSLRSPSRRGASQPAARALLSRVAHVRYGRRGRARANGETDRRGEKARLLNRIGLGCINACFGGRISWFTVQLGTMATHVTWVGSVTIKGRKETSGLWLCTSGQVSMQNRPGGRRLVVREGSSSKTDDVFFSFKLRRYGQTTRSLFFLWHCWSVECNFFVFSQKKNYVICKLTGPNPIRPATAACCCKLWLHFTLCGFYTSSPPALHQLEKT